MFVKLHARKTRLACTKKKNLLECPFKRKRSRFHASKFAPKRRIFVLKMSYVSGEKYTFHIKLKMMKKLKHIIVPGQNLRRNCYRWKTTIRFLGKWVHTHTKLNIFAGRLCRPKEMARVKFQTKSPRRILSGNVGRLCVALWKSEYESQDEGGGEDKIMMLNHVQGGLGSG